jgi:hypothetical protein
MQRSPSNAHLVKANLFLACKQLLQHAHDSIH